VELFRSGGAAAAALISATTFTVWNQSVVNEKVYTVSLMTVALLTWLVFRWRDNLGRGKDDNLLILIVFLLGLSLGNHLMAFLVAPAILLFVIWVNPRVLMRWRLYAFASLAWFLGLSAQLFLPIRAEADPVISEAAPKCESVVDATIDIARLHPPLSLLGPKQANDRCPALAQSLRREQYRKPPLNMNPIFFPYRQIPRDFCLLKWQFINYAQYFDWQWARSLDGSNTFFAWLRAPFTLIFLLLGLVGAWKHFNADRISWIYFAALFATVWLGLIIYLNFKYGYSVNATVPGPNGLESVPREWREVRERDYFFMVSFSHWGLWAGIGLAAFWQTTAELVAGAKARITAFDYKRTAPVLLLALLPLLLNWKYASRAGDYAARDWGYNLLMSIEPYGIVLTNGDNDTFPLWYLQEAEGLRKDVTVIVYSYLATPWYAKQLRDLTQPCGTEDAASDPTVIICQRRFEPDKAISMYQDRDWPLPTRPVLEATDLEIDNVPECYPVDVTTGQCARFSDTVTVTIGELVGTIERNETLMRNDILLLRIMNTSLGDRPVYFASTTGTYEKFHIQPWMIRNGASFKVEPGDVVPTGTIVPMPGSSRQQGGRDFPFWIDVELTRELLEEHYVYRDILDWTFWPDLSTSGIPLQYYQAYLALANGFLVMGDKAASDAAVERGLDFLEVAVGPLPDRPESLEPPEEEGNP
jgi:hypothetical protein